ncbi:MAG: hypothetical protein JJU29_02875 [Verrucomicrobia bacterium]|nr:hypothetical protein [Verrucomicrobiota bacterium]MCH8511116.1 hypothetical protein [Kiritimatiellia bacterium]
MNAIRSIIFAAGIGFIIFAGGLLGMIWYNAWWVWRITPTPPFTRYLLPERFVGYHTIRFEMICWATATLFLLAWLVWSMLNRTILKHQQTKNK